MLFRKASLLIILLLSFPALSDTDEKLNLEFDAGLTKYKADNKALKERVAKRIEAASNRYEEAVKLYSKKKFSESKKEIKKSYESAHAALKEKWSSDKTQNEVPNKFVKKILEFGMARESFDTMLLSISGINAVHDCSLVEVAPPKENFFSKNAYGSSKLFYDSVAGVGNINGYVDPYSQHFFKAASAIYFLGLASYFLEYEQRSIWLKDLSKKIKGSGQKESLKLNVELTTSSKDYIENQLALKKAYRQMLFSASKMAEDEANTKASRMAYRGERKGKAKKDYRKKKKRAHLSDWAAREAVKAYQDFKKKEYEYSQSTVHTHISCEEQAETAFNIHKKNILKELLGTVISRAHAEESEGLEVKEADSSLYAYYLEVIKEVKQQTNLMMVTPENRIKLLAEESMEALNKDVDITQASVDQVNQNLASLEGLYDKFSDPEAVTLEAGGGEIRNQLKPSVKSLSGTVVQGDSAGDTNSLATGLAAGSLTGSDLLNNSAARLKKLNGDIKAVKFEAPKDLKNATAGNYLSKPADFSFEKMKENSLKKLSASQKLALANSFKGIRTKAPEVEVGKEVADSKSSKGEVVIANKRKKLNLPDIEDDPALKLLKKSKKKVEKEVNLDEVEPINAESLARLRDGSATDINDDRGTSIWVIISNRYIRSGFEKLKERK